MILMILMNGVSIAGDMVFVKTDKTMYLMDPWYWVYSAANFRYWFPPFENPGFWDPNGHSRTVNFTVKTYDAIGQSKDVGPLEYNVFGTTGEKRGSLEAAGTGAYKGSFQLLETDLGGRDFTGREPLPRELVLQILNNGSEVIKEYKVYVGRWGCDRCHIAKEVAREIYPWVAPTGGGFGPHYWGNILGRNGSVSNAITKDTLSSSVLAHTPGDVLTNHEKTNRKQAGNYLCSPCHSGANHIGVSLPDGFRDLRPLWDDIGLTGFPWAKHAKSEAVECTYCHGMEGGYVPADGMWADNAGYITPEHKHKGVDALVNDMSFQTDPWLARQNCANIGCHGHINDTNEKRVDNAKPDCRLCHGIHNKNPR